MWPCSSVGRMPIITMWAPDSAAFDSASLRLARNASSNPESPPSRSLRGEALISMLNCPSSVWNSGLAIASSTSAFFSAGSARSSIRLSSISRPVIGSSASNRASASIRANTSRLRRTFSRYRVRSAPENSCCSTSSPM